MPYSDLTLEEKILFAAECIGRGVSIPSELRADLGPEVILEIENPENFTDEQYQERESASA